MKLLLFALVLIPAILFSGDFVSLMPKEQIDEFWIAESAPAEIWSVRDNIIYCKGKPNGFPSSEIVR
jgi:hypothetical protein